MTKEAEWYKKAEADVSRNQWAESNIVEDAQAMHDKLLKDPDVKAFVKEREEQKFVRPPLGLTPRYLVDEVRLEAIEKAIERYEAANYTVPEEWLAERREILERWKMLLPAVEPYVDDLQKALAEGRENRRSLPIGVIDYYAFELPIVTSNVTVTYEELEAFAKREEGGEIRITRFEEIPAVGSKT